MYIKVHSMTGGDPATITVSKLTTVQDLRDMVKERFQVEPEHQNLFFQGKKMEDEFTLFDYSVKVNNMGSLDNVPVKDIPKKKKRLTTSSTRGILTTDLSLSSMRK